MKTKLVLSLLVLGLAAAALAADKTEKKIWAKSFLNKKAPDLVVEKWLTPEPNRQGKFVLIDFWATWCKPFTLASLSSDRPMTTSLSRNFA